MKLGFNEATALECKGQSLMQTWRCARNMVLIILRSALTA